MRFPIAIFKEHTSTYGVVVPDLPGCFSAADTIDDAIDAAHDAISSHIQALRETQQPIPDPKPIEHHLSNPDTKNANFWAIVTVEDTATRAA